MTTATGTGSAAGYATRADARSALQSWQDPPRALLTTGQWLTRWLTSREHVLRASTLRAYESHVRLYLQPHLGTVPLADLHSSHVTAMFSAVARAALASAHRRGLVTGNAARDVELAPGRRPHPQVWTDARVRA